MHEKVLIFIFLFSSISIEAIMDQMKKRTFQAIIFDMDGTILDTEYVWKDASRYILDTYAQHLNDCEKDAIMQKIHLVTTLHENFALLQQHCTLAFSIDQIKEKKAQYVYNTFENKGISFVDFFPEFHNKITNLGLKSAIATNASAQALERIIKIVPLHDFFNEHIYAIDVVQGKYKPNPDIFLHAAAKIGIDPQYCVVIEDTAIGIAAAKAAGMYCIAINTSKNRDLLWQADEIVESYADIDLEKLLNLENHS